MTNEQSLTVADMFKTREQIDVLKKTVAEGATDTEFAMFAHIAKRYDLDPFAGEIYFIKYGNKPTLITSRDGYLKIAQGNANFDGIQSAAVFPDDEFDFNVAEGTINHKINTKEIEGKTPIGAWAICHHKKRKPAIAFVRFSEYKKQGNIWAQYPSVMITKVAEVMVLKKQFGINGLLTKEEIESGDEKPQVEKPVTDEDIKNMPNQEAPTEEAEVLINNKDKNRFFATFEDLWEVMKKYEPEKWNDKLKEDFRKASIKKLSGKKGLTDSMTIKELNTIILGMKKAIKKYDKINENVEDAKKTFETKELACEECGVILNEKTIKLCRMMKEFEGHNYCTKCQAVKLTTKK